MGFYFGVSDKNDTASNCYYFANFLETITVYDKREKSKEVTTQLCWGEDVPISQRCFNINLGI